MGERTIRGKTAIVGIGETTYYKRGQAPDPEFKLGLQAVLLAAEDAGIDVREIDGFASYSNDRNTPERIASALGNHGTGTLVQSRPPLSSGALASETRWSGRRDSNPRHPAWKILQY